jgi:hypothetical protein
MKDLKQILQPIYNYNVTRSILNSITDIQLFKKQIYTDQYCTLILHKFAVICYPDSIISELTLWHEINDN